MTRKILSLTVVGFLAVITMVRLMTIVSQRQMGKAIKSDHTYLTQINGAGDAC